MSTTAPEHPKSAAAAFFTPGPLGATLLAGCSIVGMLSGAENGSAISALLLFWLVLWGIGRAMKD